MIRLDGITRDFAVGDSVVHALKSVAMDIGAGEHVSLVGPSGSGKSTLLHILGCLDHPTGGNYLFDGRDVGAMSENGRARLRQMEIGFVFQFFHLLPRLTAQANVELPMFLAGAEPGERHARAREVLEKIGLGKRLSHKPEQLSGGERQRVAIARAVVMGPKVLLADEPTGNLDRASAEGIMSLLESLSREGLTLVVVTHDPGIAARGRRILRMDDGALSEEAP